MPCAPAPVLRAARSAEGDAFAFSGAPDAYGRTMENAAVMMTAPWRAYWAFAAEAMDPRNYRP